MWILGLKWIIGGNSFSSYRFDRIVNVSLENRYKFSKQNFLFVLFEGL